MSQLSLFDYSALSPDLQVEVKSASERIKLRMKRTAEDIIEIGKDLIAIKEKLPHGQFLPWIDSEFGLTDKTAQNFMNVTERFGGKSEIISDFKPTLLYLLAAPSTPDEVVEQVIEKVEAGETVTPKEVKELKQKLKATEAALVKAESDVSMLRQTNLLAQQKIEEKSELLTAAEAMLQSEAQRLAEQKAEKLKAEFEAKLKALEADKAKAEEASQKAKADYESGLAKFKANPDPETQKAILELKDKFERTKGEVDRVQHSLEKLNEKADQTFAVSLSLERFHGALQKVIANHPDAIVAMSSPFLNERQLAVIENLAELLEDWSDKIRQGLANAKEAQAKTIRSVDVEVLTDEEEW
jgi:DNA repair exonuclease SbcCD ATPase subunit